MNYLDSFSNFNFIHYFIKCIYSIKMEICNYNLMYLLQSINEPIPIFLWPNFTHAC